MKKTAAEQIAESRSKLLGVAPERVDEAHKPGNVSIRFSSPTDVVVIDPCYVWQGSDDPTYDEIGQFVLDNECGLFRGNGFEMLVSLTAHGDGVYTARTIDGQRAEFGVDAGMFCLIRLIDLERMGLGYSGGTVLHGVRGVVQVKNYGLSGAVIVDTTGRYEDEDDPDETSDDREEREDEY